MKPKHFLNALFGTLTQPSYYLYILNQKFSFCLKFLLTSYLIIGLLVSSIIIAVDIPTYSNLFAKSMAELKENYPKDLILNYQSGKLEASQTPITVFYPSVINNKYRLYQNLATIDTSLTAFNDNDSLITIGSDQLWIKDTAATQANFELKQIPFFDQDFLIDHASLDSWTQKWQTQFDQVLDQMKYLTPLFFPIALLLTRFWANFIDVVLIFLLLKISGIKLKFSKILQLSFHVMVVAEIVAQATGYIYAYSSIDMYSITYWIWFTIVFFSLRKVQTIVVVKK